MNKQLKLFPRSHFFLLQHIANHQQFFSAMSLKQAALNYVHYCDSVVLTITLNPQSPLLMKTFNWTVWFLMIDPVAHMIRRNSGPINSDMQIDLTWFQH